MPARGTRQAQALWLLNQVHGVLLGYRIPQAKPFTLCASGGGKSRMKLSGMAVHGCNASTREAEAGGSGVERQVWATERFERIKWYPFRLKENG